MAEQPSLWDQGNLLMTLPAAPEPPAAPQPPSVPETLQGPGRSDRPATSRSAALPASSAPPAPTISGAPPPTLALPSLAPPGRRGKPSAPQRILILDTETTALTPQQGQCIEVGAVLFDVPHRAVLQQISFLLPCQANPAEAINGIPAAVTRLEQPREAAQACFLALVEAAEAIVAHNAAFDRQWFGQGGLPELDRPWICSMEEIRWPADRQLRPTPSVRDLALAYGVPVWAAHRALTDCHYLVHVFERCEELEALLVAAQEPRQLYRARLSYAERHRAREAGFRWNDPVSGAWTRRLTQAEAEALPFPVVPVEAEVPAFLPHTA
jgi:DNA polymerase-3 subunit epsilon